MSELLDEVRQIRAQADCLHDEAAVNAAYDRLAARLAAEYATLNPILICVMVGGLVTTAEVSRRLDFPFEIDYLHASRYRGCLLYTSPSPRDKRQSRMPSSA